jgi:hypothetical protein
LARDLRRIRSGISFFEKLDRDIALHLTEVKAYKSGTVALRYEVRSRQIDPQNAT